LHYGSDRLSDSLGAMRRNMGAFYRLLGGHSPGGTVVERDGLVAAVVPSCPNQSVINGVVYENAEALRTVHGELKALYASAGVGVWRVWVPEADRALAAWLERSGHRLAGRQRAMILDLDRIEFELADELDWKQSDDAAVLALLNEQAYGLPAGEFAAAIAGLSGRAELYFAREQGELAACLAAIDEGGDCGIYCVATRPSSRRRGLASALMRHALADAQGRGCTTSSLQASPLGVSVYTHLGYRDRGALETWEYKSS
jgi:GNAT superfamily N-acetyltransferase